MKKLSEIQADRQEKVLENAEDKGLKLNEEALNIGEFQVLGEKLEDGSVKMKLVANDKVIAENVVANLEAGEFYVNIFESVKSLINEQEDEEGRSLSTIAREITEDWKNVNFAAKPYLEAMESLEKITDDYYQDSGSSIVAYFLSNARSWTGEKAKAIKAELNVMLKASR